MLANALKVVIHTVLVIANVIAWGIVLPHLLGGG
jgi:hypothetical protein